MKKTIIALLLVVSMVLGFTLTAVATEGGADEPKNLTVTSSFNEKEEIGPLKSGDMYTINFHNKSNGTLNWENFGLLITDGSEDVIRIRADNFGWGTGTYFPDFDHAREIPFVTNVTDWKAFMTAAQTGFDVEITLKRDGDTLTYSAKMGDYTVDMTSATKKALPETVEVFLSGENCTLTGITTTKTTFTPTEPQPTEPQPTEPVAGEITYKDVPAPELVVETFLGAKTESLPMKDGEGYHFSFYNQARGDNNWNNFVLGITTETEEVIYFRADNWVLGRGGYYVDGSCNYTNIADWAAFMDDAHKGFLVDLKIGMSNGVLYYEAKMGDEGQYIVTHTAIPLKALPDTLNVFLSGDACALSSNSSFAPIPPAPVITDTEVGVKEAEKIEGSLSANEFFKVKTDAVALKSGESLTLTFKNRSRGVENWHNYVLAVVGATGEAYTGIDQEILIIRADNYGWGGGMSDFGTLNFVTNVTDWEAFKTDAKIGLDVELLLERSGDTLHYLSKMGDYTFELTATSSKALPETAYVFLTGEQVSLTNITSVKGGAAEIEPQEPDTPVTAEKIEGDLTAGAFLSAKSANIPLWDGGEYTFKFHNKSVGAQNWENFLLGVTTGSEDVILIRADSFGWGTGTYFPAFENAGDDIPFVTNVGEEDWPAFVAAAQAGFDVEITLKRDGDTLTYAAKMGDYTVDMTSTALTALPETIYVYLSGENCELTGITTEGDPGTMPEGYEPADPDEPDTPDEPEIPELAEKIEGDLAVEGFDTSKTNAIPLYDGGEYTLKFHAKSTGAENWDNFVLGVASGDEYILYLRADNYVIGFGNGYFEDGIMECNIEDWAAFVADAQAGFDVEISLSREGNTLIYTAKMGDLNPMARMGSYTVTLTATALKALPAELSVYLTGEKVELTDIATEGDPGEKPTQPVDPEPTEPQPTEPEPTEPQPTEPQTYTPKIEGALDVAGLFSAKTNMVPLKSGESYTFSFTNTTKGSNNYDNFILAVVGATGAAYTGAEQEILVIRADNWGWGGGMSDFVDPAAASGNKLAFETNINWDQWVAACKAGLPVTVTISRRGDTLTYEATLGEWFVKLTATSGKALPQTAYVFLTGENCTLSNIKTVSAPTYSSPKTGDTAPAILWIALLALLASLAASGVVVTKKLLKK